MVPSSIKMPMPGYGVAIIDEKEDDGDDKFDTPQVGQLVLISMTDEDKECFDYETLINETIYWAKYADQDGTFFDKELGKDIVFIRLSKIVGYDN